MATTLKKLSSQIIEILSGGDQSKDSQLDERMMYEHIRQAIASLLKMQEYEKRELGDRSVPGLHIATYTALLQEDSAALEAYFTLPDVPLTMAYNKGLHRVHPVAKPNDWMIRTMTATSSKGLPAGNLEKKMGYYLEGHRIILHRYKNKDKFPKGAVIKMIVPFPTSQQPDDLLPITPEHEAQVIQMIIEKYNPGLSQDRLNDNVDDVRDFRSNYPFRTPGYRGRRE